MQPMKLLKPGENSRVEVRAELDGSALLTISPQATRFIQLSRENAIGMALALLKASGVPIEEAYNRKKAEMNGAKK